MTAGVTSAVALPLLAAAGSAAFAADGKTWDKVAQCESDALWSANTGNGYYGGLQLTREQWDEHGGRDYADRPDYASRGQQIAVGEQILNAEGPDAFPRCADLGGLRQDAGNPEIDPGRDYPDYARQDTRAREHTAEPGSGDEAFTDGGGRHRGPESAEGRGEQGNGSGKGRHRGTPDNAPVEFDGTIGAPTLPTPADVLDPLIDPLIDPLAGELPTAAPADPGAPAAQAPGRSGEKRVKNRADSVLPTPADTLGQLIDEAQSATAESIPAGQSGLLGQW
ncbi:transglycosylase family protein [Streptomyces polyrhachis]|uniref:Transglycosylase family protein n=1 Tax=Streptomyces polyrhachis TaxID=1282885 RepID=A0ABW2GM39_9ACTN